MAGSPAKKPIEMYGLDPSFERMVATMACCRPTFYGTVGHAMQAERLAVAPAALALCAAQAHAKDTGRGASSPLVVVQRIRRWVTEGRQTQEELNDVIDMIDDHADSLPDEREVAAEVVPVMTRLLHGETALAAIEAYKKGEGFDAVEKMIQQSRAIGVIDKSIGSKLGVGVLDNIAAMRQADRLGTGVLELDVRLGGGLPRGCTGLFVAPAKAGKSQWLINVSACALEQGMFVAMVTLELSEEDQQARLIANLTGMPIDAIADVTNRAEVERRLNEKLPTLGVFRVKFYPAKITTMEDIADWVKEIEAEEGRKIDALIIDYVDEMGVTNKTLRSEYEVQGQAMRDVRLYVHGRSIYGWTAAQPKRRDVQTRTKRLEIDDIADSMKKGRIADLIITCIRPSEQEVEMFVAGFRYGEDKFSVGPLVHEFACARFVPRVE